MKHATHALTGALLALTHGCADTVRLGTVPLDAGARDDAGFDAPDATPVDDRAPSVDAPEATSVDAVDVIDAVDVVDAVEASVTCPAVCDDGVFCNGRERCVDGRCVPGPPPCDDGRACTADRCVEEWSNCEHVPADAACAVPDDVCAEAIHLDGPGVYEGTTVGGRDRFVLSCQTQYVPAVRNEVAYQFTLRETSDVWITPLYRDPAAGDTAVSLVTGCAPTRELACGRMGLPFVRRRVPPGVYGILVETRTPAGYRFSFDVRRPDAAPPGDVCPSGASDVVELSDERVHAFERVVYQSDWHPSCSFSELQGPDVVTRLTLTEPRSVEVRVDPFTWAELFTGPCEGGASLLCRTGADIVRRRLEAGTYWVRAVGPIVDSIDPPLSLRAVLGPPEPAPDGDRCPTTSSDAVVDLAPGTRHVVMRWFDHDVNLGCMFPHAPSDVNPDLVYRLRLSSRQRVVIEAASAARPDLELLRGDCQSGEVLQCSGALSAPASSTRRIDQTLDAGTYWLRVSGSSRAEFDLQVTVE